ncbi:MAG: hypothetical protein RLZZ455_255 [Candidatus Parcubacteria bacterium]|jgi:bifunctional UDP-N-acetylglucosamine pyrophosphorylase/glucosamine-1-phosphate N-acetyltransferase
MQAILLAAGQSSRLFPFGGDTHKAAVRLMGKSLIARSVEALRESGIEKIIIVVSPDNGIESALAEDGISRDGITFVTHIGAKGMGEALLDAKRYVTEDFFLIHAHHFECALFLPRLLTLKEQLSADGAVVIREEARPEGFGIVSLDKERIVGVVEKPESAENGYRVVGMYVLPPAFFTVLEKAEKHHYSFESALNEFAGKAVIVGLKTTEQTITLKYPWHLLEVADYLLRSLKRSTAKTAKIATSAVITGEVVISDGVVIEDGAVIKGPCFLGENAYVGTNAILRNNVIVESGAVVGANMEVKHSIIMASTTTHSGYIGDSVIGKSCKLAAFFCTGNVRIDREPVSVIVKEQKVDSGQRSLGVCIGDHSKVGIRVSTMPGVLIGKHVVVGPSTTVFKNIPSDVRYYSKITEVIEQKNEDDEVSAGKVILFDIDYTLFDTKTYKDSELKIFQLYSEVVEALGELGPYAELGIFSEGEEAFQKAKLVETAIEERFHKNYVHVVAQKRDVIKEIAARYSQTMLFLVDDRLEVLYRAKETDPKIYTIWMKRGPFAAAQQPIDGFSPDAEIEDLRMVLPIVAGVEN